MNIRLKRTQKQIELVQKMGSKNKAEAIEAREAFAAVAGPLVQLVLSQAPVISNLFSDLPVDENSDNSIPVDLFFDIKDDEFIKVWSQSQPGGLATNLVGGVNEIKFSTYKLDSAISLYEKYLRSARLDVLSRAMTRMAQEVLIKQETISANVVMAALANASTNDKTHVIQSNADNVFGLVDFNKLMTLKSRIYTSFIKGTTNDARGRGVTDLLVSPEIMESLRSIAYNPVNTVAGPAGSEGTPAGSNTAIPATNDMREEIYRSAGNLSFYGINLLEINELGVGYKFNTLFDSYAGSTTYGGSTFDGAADEIIIGIDAGMESLIRPVLTQGEQTFTVIEDDQFVRRQGKVGWYGAIEEGRLVLDDRALVGVIC